MTDSVVAESTQAVIDRFNEAFNRRDVDAIMALMTDDCAFESTLPPPDGVRHEGQARVRRIWDKIFTASPDITFETEDQFVAGDRSTVCWVMRYTGADGTPQRLRGVDVFRVRDGKVSEKKSYVKG